ncbi:hypothetical protein GmHk_15G044271 [Glycine max]|nr:hypothetical protein GmHk_15G044271 [Glycine max]
MTSRKRKSISTRPTSQYDTRRFHSFEAWTRYTDNVLRDIYFLRGSSEGPSPKQVRVRGHVVKIDADSLNTFLETPVVLAKGETLLAYSRYCRLLADIREIEAALCIPGQGSVLNVEGHLGKILRKDLTTLAQVWSVHSYSNLAPTSHTSDLIVDQARLIFGLVSQMDMNVGAFISVINLAYIRKNCWNPDDLTITIRGARRARTRPVEAPSISIAPSPACTLVAPSASAPADFQRFEAMLQSIHQGQIILLQSLQMVAPPDFIPSVEQFNEWVVWPGTQSSLHREDEGPTTQVPQQMEDESSEITTLEPLVRRKKADQTQEAAATSEKSLEATFEPLEPVADTTSLQQAANPSIPENQTTPVLSPNTSPIATPVLHLTDEEDVHTQDTQDRSQDF